MWYRFGHWFFWYNFLEYQIPICLFFSKLNWHTKVYFAMYILTRGRLSLGFRTWYHFVALIISRPNITFSILKFQVPFFLTYVYLLTFSCLFHRWTFRWRDIPVLYLEPDSFSSPFHHLISPDLLTFLVVKFQSGCYFLTITNRRLIIFSRNCKNMQILKKNTFLINVYMNFK